MPDDRGLRPASYQLIPLARTLANKLNGILIADGVGAGKTISAGYILCYSRAKFSRPCFVVCSPTLLAKWIFELKSKFSAMAVPVRSVEDLETARDESEHRAIGKDQPIYVMSNSLLSKTNRESYPDVGAVVFDEIHTYRNVETIWHRGSLELAKASTVRIGLTATPINNSLDDLSAELCILLPSFSCEAVSGAVSDLWNSSRETLTNALTTRFLKEKLGIHFAKRLVSSVVVSYPDSYVRRVRAAISEKSQGGTVLEQVTYYRLAASSPRAFWSSLGLKEEKEQPDPKSEKLVEILTKHSLTHWLVFCEFKDTAESLMDKLTLPHVSLYTLTGDTPMFEREAVVESFRNSQRGVLIMTSVGSEGLDLQFCGGIVNYDLHWNPMKLEQRAGRIDRVGQKKNLIKIVNIHVANSIDNRVLSVIKRKLELISNSVFATREIVSTGSEAPTELGMYSEEVLAQEIAAGSSLLETFKLNQSIEPRDYEALSSVNTSFCDPSILLKNAGHLEARSLIGMNKWIQRVESDAHSLVEILDYYS